MLLRKMLRDIRVNKTQFIAIFLMIFLGVFIFAGVNSDWNGMRVHSSDFYKETKLADVWVYGSTFQSSDIEKIKATNQISDVERRAVLKASVSTSKKKNLNLYLLENNTISQMKIMVGENYSKDKDGIWIDQSYAEANHIKVGDMYSLESNGITIKKQVKGIILHPEFVYQNSDNSILPDHKNHGYVMMSSKFFPQSEQVPFTQLLIRTKNPLKMESIISDTLQESNLTFTQKEDLISYATLEDEIVQHQAFAQVFPIVFLLIAILTTMTTVSKMIINQRIQCGILKALGFKNRKIMLHYLSHVVFIATLGAILGFIAGPLVVPALIYPMMTSVYILPELVAEPLMSSVYMVVISIIVCFLAAYLIGRKQLKEKPAVTFRPVVNKAMKNSSKQNKLWKHFNFYAQWNIRDVFRNKIRSMIAIIGVCGCMGLMLCAFGMKDSMDNMMDMMFQKLQTYEMKVQVDPSADINMLKTKMEGSAIQEGAIEIKNQVIKQTGTLLVQEDNNYMKLINQDLNYVDLPQTGIALSYNIAESLNLSTGDTLSWRMIGSQKWSKSVIKTIIHTPSSQGITISKDAFIKKGYSFAPTSIVGKDASIQKIAGVKNVQYLQKDIAQSVDTMMEGMNLMIFILIFGAVVLGLVVLYNIGTFSYIEKYREMATLKVLGFQDKQVKKLLRQQNFWMTIVGIIIGLPFGYLLIYTVISTVSDSMDMLITINPITYIGCSLATLIISVHVMKRVTKKVKKIDMVSSLKSIE